MLSMLYDGDDMESILKKCFLLKRGFPKLETKSSTIDKHIALRNKEAFQFDPE